MRVPPCLSVLTAAALAVVLSAGLAACGGDDAGGERAEAGGAARFDDGGPPARTAPEMPHDAPPQEEVDPDMAPLPLACREQVGEAAAAALAERCRAVSPATRPPCNPANPCALIQQEIDRACGQHAPDARPAQCVPGR